MAAYLICCSLGAEQGVKHYELGTQLIRKMQQGPEKQVTHLRVTSANPESIGWPRLKIETGDSQPPSLQRNGLVSCSTTLE